MCRRWKRVYWLLAIIPYWYIVVWFLRSASPVFFDGAGPMPSFYWGRAPLPDSGEYYNRQDYYDLLFSVPYWVVGLIITLAGCIVTAWLRDRIRPAFPNEFRGGFAVTLSILVALALLNDGGSLLDLRTAPLFLLHGDYSPYTIVAMFKVFLPGPILSGLLEYVRRKYFCAPSV